MQQIVILNYSTCEVHVYTIDSSEDPEEFIVNDLGLSIDEVSWMCKNDIIHIEIHCD